MIVRWTAAALLRRPLCLALMLAAAGLRGASSWPQFRGVNCQGVAEREGPPTDFGPGTNLLWKIELARGLSSPCLWGDRIFLTAVENEKLHTLCVRRRDGKLLWRQAAPIEKTEAVHKVSSPATATPVSDGKRVCVYFASFGLLAYDLTGRERWRKPLPMPFVVNGSGTSPALAGGRLLLNCDQQGRKSFLLAVEPRTGKTLWQTPRPDFPSGYTTPVFWARGDTEEIVVAGSLRVVGYGLRDGQEHWSARGLEAVSVCPTPALGGGQLYVMSRSLGTGPKVPGFVEMLAQMDHDHDGRIARAEAAGFLRENGAFDFIDRDQDGFITEQEWTETGEFVSKGEHGIFALRSPGQGDITATHVAWKHKRGVAQIASPLFYRSRVYVVEDGGRVTCYDAKSGNKLYEQERLGAEGEYFASPVAANGKIAFASSRGVVSVIDAGDRLNVVARNDLGEAIQATPAIFDSKLYVRSANHLWSFGK